MSPTSLGEAVVEVGADASRFRSDVNRDVSGALDAATRNATRSVSNISRIMRRGAVVGFGALTYGAAAFVKSSVDAERAYSTTMRVIQAATAASDAQIKQLNDTAIKLGQDTSFSAQEAASGMLALGKSGLKTNEILAAIPEVMNLAATEGLKLDDAAGIVTASLAQFNLKAKDSADVVNALAGASTASRASVAGIGESLKLVGSAAAGIGLTVPETTAALAALAESGLEGSIAGTSLATVFNRLTPTTTKAKNAMSALNLDFTDAQGNFDSMDVIAGKLAVTFKDMDAESRKIALGEIFGKDASVIAAVNALVRQGEDGLKGFTRASEDSSAAQKLAKARLSGTEGALERMSGAVETAKLRLGQELAPVVEDIANGLAKNLVPTLEAVLDGAKALGEAVAPVVSEIAVSIGDLVSAGDGAGGMFYGTFIPAVRTASQVLGSILGFINDLPGPVKEIGIQAGIAALILPRLTGAVTGVTSSIGLSIARLKQFQAELTYTATRTQATATAMTKLGGAARAAAGIGGLVALTQGMKDAESTGSKLLTLLGGGATGFSVGGPIGAVVGVVAAGALIKFKGQVENADTSTRNAVEGLFSYADSLREVDGAATGATRKIAALALQEAGAFPLAQQLGLSYDTITKAALGNEAAIEKVSRVIERQTTVQSMGENAMGELTITQGKYARQAAELGAILHVATGELTKQQREARILSVASGELSRKLGDVQNKGQITTRLTMSGKWPTSVRDVAELTRGLKLTPKKLDIVLKAFDIEGTGKRVKNLQRTMQETGNTKVDASTFTQSVKNLMSNGGGIVDKGGGKIKQNLRKAGDAKIDNKWINSLKASLTQGKGAAEKGSPKIGNAITSGVLRGVGDLSGLLSGKVRAAVDAAIVAGMEEAKAHSPSERTRDLGHYLMEGLALGVEEAGPKAVKAMTEQLTKLQDKTKEKLSALREEFTSISESIASAFGPDLFSAESLNDFFKMGNESFGELKGVKKALKVLRNWGIDPKFLAALFASGNAGLIMELAEGGKRQALDAAALFTDIGNLGSQLGNDVARNVLGPKIDKTNDKLDQIRDAIKALGGNKNKGGNGKAPKPIPGTSPASAAAGADGGGSSMSTDDAILRQFEALRSEVRALTGVTASGPVKFGQTLNGVMTDARVRSGAGTR